MSLSLAVSPDHVLMAIFSHGDFCLSSPPLSSCHPQPGNRKPAYLYLLSNRRLSPFIDQLTWGTRFTQQRLVPSEDLLALEQPDLGVQILAFEYKQHQTNLRHEYVSVIPAKGSW